MLELIICMAFLLISPLVMIIIAGHLESKIKPVSQKSDEIHDQYRACIEILELTKTNNIYPPFEHMFDDLAKSGIKIHADMADYMT